MGKGGRIHSTAGRMIMMAVLLPLTDGKRCDGEVSGVFPQVLVKEIVQEVPRREHMSAAMKGGLQRAKASPSAEIPQHIIGNYFKGGFTGYTKSPKSPAVPEGMDVKRRLSENGEEENRRSSHPRWKGLPSGPPLEDNADVIYLKSDLLRDVRAKDEGRKPNLLLDSAFGKPADVLTQNCQFSKSQMVSPKASNNAMWTLWLNALKNSSN